MSELDHSPLGPSASERWIPCPGSVKATAHLPDRDSEYALEGTAAHSLAEYCREHDVPARSRLGTIVTAKRVDGTLAEYVVDEEMADAVQVFIDHVNSLPGFDFNETRVSYESFVPDGFGTMDAARGNDGTVYVRDLKYGKGVQKWAKENTQLMLYALGFYCEYRHLFDIEQFDLGIVQPRLDHIDIWAISLKDLLKWAREVLVPAARLTQDESAPFEAGAWCQFCKLRATCATRATSVFKAAVGEFEDLDAAIDAPLRLVGGLTNEQIARVLDALPQIRKWCSDIEGHARSEVASGRAVGEYKFVAGKSSREYVGDGDDGTGQLLTVMYPEIDPSHFWEMPTLKSVAKVEALVGRKRFTEFAAAWVKKVPGRPTLVPGSDKRPALALDPSQEFDNLEDEE